MKPRWGTYLLILIALVVLYLVGFYQGKGVADPVYITKKEFVDRMVPVDVVRQIEVPVPGKPVVIEKIVYTDPEPPEFNDTPETVYVEVPPDASKMKGRIDATLRKEVAQLEDGVLVGWSGEFTCSVSFGEEWQPLVTRSLSREHTTVSSTLPYESQRRLHWTARGGYGVGFDGEVYLAAIGRKIGRVEVGVTGIVGQSDAAAIATVGWSW